MHRHFTWTKRGKVCLTVIFNLSLWCSVACAVCVACAPCARCICIFCARDRGVCARCVCFLCVLGDRVSVQWCERWMCVCVGVYVFLCLFNKNRNLVSCVRNASLILIYNAHLTRMKEETSLHDIHFQHKRTAISQHCMLPILQNEFPLFFFHFDMN